VENPKWTADEIERYLLLLAKEAAGSLTHNWSDFIAAVERQGAESAQIAQSWQLMLDLGPTRLGQALLNDTAGRALRRVAPLCAIVPRERREELLRDCAVSGSCAELYSVRWQGNAPDEWFVDAIVAHLLASIDEPARDAFSEFVAACGCTKWIVAADFRIADAKRPNDVFGYTVFPYDAAFDALASEIQSVFPKDLKGTKTITSRMIAYLRSKRRLHLAFVVNRDRKLFKGVDEAREAIDRTIQMMLAYQDVERHRETIGRIRALRQEANSNRFNFRLFQDIILMAAFGAFIAMLLQLEGRAELIGLFPDEDKMTTAYGAMAYATFAIDASSFALRRRVPESQIAYALPGPRADGKKGLYYDELIRIPDYIAGALAGTDLTPLRPTSVSRKCLEIVAGAFVDNPNVAILRVDLPPKGLSASRIVIQSTPPTTTMPN
jgi:hypothetical protein